MWLWKCEKKRKFLLLLLLLIAGDLPLTVASVCKTFVAPLLFGDFLLLLFFVLFCFFFILVCVFVPFSALSKKSHTLFHIDLVAVLVNCLQHNSHNTSDVCWTSFVSYFSHENWIPPNKKKKKPYKWSFQYTHN